MTVFLGAAREALGAPALAMAATFLAFGAAVQAAGLGIGWAVACALLVYGMPGQMVLVGGSGSVAAVPAAAAANARFLPMAIALAPWLGEGAKRWLALPFIAVTPWAMAMRALPGLPQAQRLRWFLGFALASWALAGLSTVAGFALAPGLPAWLLALLLLVNPLYFGVILAGEARRPFGLRAAICGAAVAPLLLVLPSSWGLLGAGLVGGTAAVLWGRARGRR